MWTLTTDKSWNSLRAEFSWIRDMEGVPQDPRYHAEGDVAVHTRMVLDAMEALPEYRLFPDASREILWAASLLHDVEKRSTTVQEEDGSITSRGHAKRGERSARRILFEEIETPFFIREHIAALVRYHGLPLWVFSKPDPAKALVEASLRLDTRMLATLARADVLGRIAPHRAELLERVDFFQAFCEEQGVWGEPKRFPSGRAMFQYFHRDDAAPDYEPFDDTRCTVTLLSGLPGMGKDHWISTHVHPDVPVISLDNIRRAHKLKPDDRSAQGWVAQQAKEAAKSHLRAGQDFVWNATAFTREMRSKHVDLFTTYKAFVRIVYIEVPHRAWLSQNRGREWGVPAPVMVRMLDRLEVPLPFEAHEVIYHTGG